MLAMKILGISQARLGSSRLPGKVLREVEGTPLLALHLRRAGRSKLLSQLMVATTVDPQDDRIVSLVSGLGLPVSRGSVHDVLDRFYRAAQDYQPDYVVRITSDCPLIDPELMDQVIDRCLEGGYDYASNALKPTYPDGVDVEVFRFSSLEKAWREAALPSEREHVTPYIWKNSTVFEKDLFRGLSFEGTEDCSRFRLTVDEPSDFELIEALVEALGPEKKWSDYVDFLREHAEWMGKNAAIGRNEGYLKSLRKDTERK